MQPKLKVEQDLHLDNWGTRLLNVHDNAYAYIVSIQQRLNLPMAIKSGAAMMSELQARFFLSLAIEPDICVIQLRLTLSIASRLPSLRMFDILKDREWRLTRPHMG